MSWTPAVAAFLTMLPHPTTPPPPPAAPPLVAPRVVERPAPIPVEKSGLEEAPPDAPSLNAFTPAAGAEPRYPSSAKLYGSGAAEVTVAGPPLPPTQPQSTRPADAIYTAPESWRQPAPAAEAAPQALPALWHGTWRGRNVITANGQTRVVPTAVDVQPLAGGRVTWHITTTPGPATTTVSRFELAPAGPGCYDLDEKDGCRTRATISDDGARLSSSFRVGPLLVHSVTECTGDEVVIEREMFDTTRPDASRSRAPGAPEVNAYPLVGRERVTLKREGLPVAPAPRKAATFTFSGGGAGGI